MSNNPVDLHQISFNDLINLISSMSFDQLRTVLPEFHRYYQARKSTWNIIREISPPSDNSLEVEAFNAILLIQSHQWSRTEIENKILDIFGRIKEQEEIILYEIAQEIAEFK